METDSTLYIHRPTMKDNIPRRMDRIHIYFIFLTRAIPDLFRSFVYGLAEQPHELMSDKTMRKLASWTLEHASELPPDMVLHLTDKVNKIDQSKELGEE